MEIGVTEYDAAGRWKKTLYCEYRDYNHDIWSQTPVERILRFWEYDVAGNEIRTTTFDAKTGRATQEYVDEWDAAGNCRRISDTQWSSYEGFEESIRRTEYGYDAAGNKITREITEYRADGTVIEYTVHELDAEGNGTGLFTTYDGNGKKKR